MTTSHHGDTPLRVIPLGGLGEIGLNCLILEYGDVAIAIDCGVMFPDPGMLGVDMVIPEMEYLRDLGDRLRAFVITHGHEDHIGALPYYLRDRIVPVHATPMAAGLITSRLREHRLDSQVPVHTFRPRERWEIGPFKIDPVHMTHSIVDTVALVMETPVGIVVHSGDFKIDQTPLDGRPPDLQALADYGARGVTLLLSDSTNVESPGTTGSERSVRGGIEQVFHDTAGRVFFSTFSSHIHRIQQVLELSELTGRRVGIVGRSLQNSTRIAMDLGHLRSPLPLFTDVGDIASIPRHQLTLLTAGSQGEPLSALTRISMNDHPHVKMEPGDGVVLSSRIIPGNERAIGNMVNHMYRRGVQVHDSRNADVHVSGHASRQELALMLNLIKPRFFMPLHGEYRHLFHHCRLAHSLGVPEDSAFLVEDGQVLEVWPDRAARAEPVPAGRVFVDGKGIGDIGDIVLRDRRHLSRDGFLIVVLALDQHSGAVLSGPDFVSRGLFDQEEAPRYYEEAREVVAETLRGITAESRTDPLEVKEEVRKALRRFVRRSVGRSPVVLPFVMEM